MRKLFVVLATASVTTAAFLACTGSDPDPSGPPITQGAAGGTCFPDGTCNPGLDCVVTAGKAKCTSPNDGSVSTPKDSGTPITPDKDAEAGGPVPTCKLAGVTHWACKDDQDACYDLDEDLDAGADADAGDAGDADEEVDSGPSDSGPTSCIARQGGNCTATQLKWQCHSSTRCESGYSCCSTGTLSFDTNADRCAESALHVENGGATKCISEQKCPDTQTKLCQSDNQCGTGQYCTLAKVISSLSSLTGTIVGVCRDL